MLRPTLTGPAAVPPNLIAAISPATTSQSTPGAVVLTASATGGTGAQTWAWAATYADGTSAAALLSGSGASRTLTTTAYYLAVRVVATATDAAGQTSAASALVEVGAPAALVSGGNLASTELVSGTTSQAFTFAAATGGAGTVTYALAVSSISGAVTLSTSTGRSATLQGLTDGEVAQVTLTATDALGQSVTATGVWGVAAAPVFDTSARWNSIAEYDYRTFTPASRSGAGSITSDGKTFVLAVNTGSASASSLAIDSTGLVIGGTLGAASTLSVYMETNAYTNWKAIEHLLIDGIITLPASMITGSTVQVGVGDASYYNTGNAYALSLGQGGGIVGRRCSSGTSTTPTVATGVVSPGQTWAFQILISSGVADVSLKQQSSYIAGPNIRLDAAMLGTYSYCVGGAAVATGSTRPKPMSTMRVQMAITGSSGTMSGMTLQKIRFSRATAPTSV